MGARVHLWHKLGSNGTRAQFLVAAGLAASCGLINKLQLFPMNYIAGPSRCHALLSAPGSGGEVARSSGFGAALGHACSDWNRSTSTGADVDVFVVQSIMRSAADCVERVDFVVESSLVRQGGGEPPESVVEQANMQT